MGEERRLVCLRRYGWLNTARARSTCNRAIMSVYVGVNRRIAAMEHSLVPTVLVTQASVEDLQLVERLCGCLRGRPKQLLTRHLTSAATVWRRTISDAASARTKYITHRRNLSHLDAGTATHASPGLCDDVFSEVTAPAVILLRGCLNFTEGGLGDESIVQQGLGYVEVHLEVPLPLCHALQRDATTWRRGQII